MPIDANPSAPATAAPAAILFSFIVNSFISCLAATKEGGLPHTAKRQGAHDYLPISISCHRPRSLATSPGRFAIWIAERDHRALLMGMALVIGGAIES
jgi:hypothetical protein